MKIFKVSGTCAVCGVEIEIVSYSYDDAELILYFEHWLDNHHAFVGKLAFETCEMSEGERIKRKPRTI